MVVRLNIKSDLDKFAARLDDLGKRQVRFAAANALNDVVKLAAEEMKKEMPKIFDRPTPYTLNAVIPLLNANKRNLTAAVAIRNKAAGKSTPQEHYLSPEILGGTRATKNFEDKIGLGQLIPGTAALLDQYGNVKRSQINDILGNLRITSTPANKAQLRRLERRGMLIKTSKGMANYFVAKSKRDGAPIGIWKYLGPGKVGPAFVIPGRAPTYRERLPFDAFVLASYRKNFHLAMQKRFAEAMASAKSGGGTAL